MDVRRILDPNNQSDPDYPWSDPVMAMFVSTPGLVEQHQRFLRDNNPLVDPIMGYGSIHRVDLHVQRVNANYSVVFWGGRGNETGMMWSFHIARARPEGIVLNPRQFYPTHDQHVDLAAEHLRVLVETRRRVISPTDIRPIYTPLREGQLCMEEGGTVHLEHSPVNGPQTLTPIDFPIRPRQRPITNHVLLTL